MKARSAVNSPQQDAAKANEKKDNRVFLAADEFFPVRVAQMEMEIDMDMQDRHRQTWIDSLDI